MSAVYQQTWRLVNANCEFSSVFCEIALVLHIIMPNKCGVFNCRGNYNDSTKCRVFKLPKDESERQKWVAVLPTRENFGINPTKFYICERHWPTDTLFVKIPGGSTRPVSPPSIFDVPTSCLPTSKPTPRPSKKEDKRLHYFLEKDKISSLSDFKPEKELKKKTDFYRTKQDKEHNIGFFPGVAEKIAREAFKKFQLLAQENEDKKLEKLKLLEEQLAAQEVAHEEEVTTENAAEEEKQKTSEKPAVTSNSNNSGTESVKGVKVSDSYNGADRGSYRWTQSIHDVDIRVKLPPHVTQAKQVKVDLSVSKLSVKLLDPVDECSELVNGQFLFKNKEFVWTLVPGEYIHVFLEKCDDRWWEAVFTDEPKINLQEIEATMPMEDLDSEAHAKVQELMFNEHQKRTGGLTSDQIKMQGILKGAWDQEGSPFKGMPFDPSIVQIQNSGSM